MSAPSDGGPAFPLADSCCEYGNTNRSNANGMTLRDHFAAKAMAALLVADGTTRFDDRAREAYDVADAMLRAREVKS